MTPLMLTILSEWDVNLVSQVYVWGRRNQHVNMSFLGLFNFNAPWLPWVCTSFVIFIFAHVWFYLREEDL
jgi:hypothetical protein